jgi:signal transduction histidine kinase
VAAEVVLRTGPRVGWIVLLLVNGAFYGVLVDLWHADNPVFAACLYGGFQLFAALTVDSMKRAQIAAAELRLSNAELLATRSLLAESARDGERLRVSRELHDVVGHKLSALSLNLEMLHVDSSTPARRELRLARELSQEILSDIRGVVSSLRDHDGIDLQEALTRLTSMFPAPAISLHLQPGLRVAGTQRAEALLRCAQEALANVARHARAAHAEVSLSEDPTHVSLTVEDDGSFAGELNPGNGLTGLKERIESLRGTVTIDRGARGGCRVVARLPRLD